MSTVTGRRSRLRGIADQFLAITDGFDEAEGAVNDGFVFRLDSPCIESDIGGHFVCEVRTFFQKDTKKRRQ